MVYGIATLKTSREFPVKTLDNSIYQAYTIRKEVRKKF